MSNPTLGVLIALIMVTASGLIYTMSVLTSHLEKPQSPDGEREQ